MYLGFLVLFFSSTNDLMPGYRRVVVSNAILEQEGSGFQFQLVQAFLWRFCTFSLRLHGSFQPLWCSSTGQRHAR